MLGVTRIAIMNITINNPKTCVLGNEDELSANRWPTGRVRPTITLIMAITASPDIIVAMVQIAGMCNLAIIRTPAKISM